MTDTNITVASAFTTLARKFPGIVGDYDKPTHSMHVFLTIRGVMDFHQWRRQAERVRRQAVMRHSNLIDVWTADPSAPKLIDAPSFAITFDRQTDSFAPCVNIACVTQNDFFQAQARAIAGAAEANLWRERHGRLPEAADLDGTDLVYYQTAKAGVNADAAIADLLSRINANDRGL